MKQRYKLTIEYMGADYAGWQKQKDIMSIQQAIEEAIEKFCGKPAALTTAGRTDAGVHAFAQVAHIDLSDFSKPMDGFHILKAINAHLRPQPISIIKVEKVDAEFHARFHAVNKLYRYRIVNRPGFLAVDRGFTWHVGRELDVAAMNEGAKYLLGKHDFTTFRSTECQAKSPIRTLDRLEVTEKPYDTCGGREIIIEVEGQSFLHHQVRNFAGTLVQVGKGKWKPEDVKTALEAKDRAEGGQTAPSDGLYLVRIDY